MATSRCERADPVGSSTRRLIIDIGEEYDGYCPICEGATVFVAYADTYRDHLVCKQCLGLSTPRQRALMQVLHSEAPEWRALDIHESSPSPGALSNRLAEARYTATQFYPDEPLGSEVDGFRNENLESQTFEDNVFDLVIALDVLEHVNRPERVFTEVQRTLRPGGCFIFTVPTYAGMVVTERMAEYDTTGVVHFLGEPEYHENPVNRGGSPVTFHYGYDLPALIGMWTDLETTVARFHRPSMGVIGDMTEVYVARRRVADASHDPGLGRAESSPPTSAPS